MDHIIGLTTVDQYIKQSTKAMACLDSKPKSNSNSSRLSVYTHQNQHQQNSEHNPKREIHLRKLQELKSKALSYVRLANTLCHVKRSAKEPHPEPQRAQTHRRFVHFKGFTIVNSRTKHGEYAELERVVAPSRE